MNLRELLTTLNEENLYDYSPFIIGAPDCKLAWAIGSGENEGILEVSPGTWKFYLYERGGIRYSLYDYTEDTVCKMLLEQMRNRKRFAQKRHRGRKSYNSMKLDFDSDICIDQDGIEHKIPGYPKKLYLKDREEEES